MQENNLIRHTFICKQAVLEFFLKKSHKSLVVSNLMRSFAPAIQMVPVLTRGLLPLPDDLISFSMIDQIIDYNKTFMAKKGYEKYLTDKYPDKGGTRDVDNKINC